MRPRLRSQNSPRNAGEDRSLKLVRVRRAQRHAGHEGRELKSRSRRRGGRGGGRSGRPPVERRPGQSFWGWLGRLFGVGRKPAEVRRSPSALTEQESRVVADFCRHFRLAFHRPELVKLALTHRSYLSVTGQGPRESNERLEFLGDSVLGLVTSEFLYREHPNEHEGHLTKTKSLLVSKAILSRRALAMGLGRFVLMSQSEIESGGRQRLSILADAFESVVGAVYLDQGFEAARHFIVTWLLRDTREIVADKRHTNYKSHLQEYVQSTFRTHPVYRIRSQVGPDHSKEFNVEVMVGRRVLGTGRGQNKKDAEQAAARNALEQVETRGADGRRSRTQPEPPPVERAAEADRESGEEGRRRRGRRGGRGRERERDMAPAAPAEPPRAAPVMPAAVAPPARQPARPVLPPPPPGAFEDDFEEVGRPEGPLEERHVDPYAWESGEGASEAPLPQSPSGPGGRAVEPLGGRLRQPERTWVDEEESGSRSWSDAGPVGPAEDQEPAAFAEPPGAAEPAEPAEPETRDWEEHREPAAPAAPAPPPQAWGRRPGRSRR